MSNRPIELDDDMKPMGRSPALGFALIMVACGLSFMLMCFGVAAVVWSLHP